MSNSAIGNMFLLLSILTTSLAQVTIKMVFSDIPPGSSPKVVLFIILTTAHIWRVSLFVLLIVCGFIFWLLCLNKLPLSYAYTIACSSALVVAVLSVVFLRETVTWRLWVGTLLITLGTAFVISKG